MWICLLYFVQFKHSWWMPYSGEEGKLLSKHPRISLIVLSMPVSGRTSRSRSMDCGSCSKTSIFQLFHLPSTFTAVTSWFLGNRCPEWFNWLITQSLKLKTRAPRTMATISVRTHATFLSISSQFHRPHWECVPCGAYHVMEEGEPTPPSTHTEAAASH